MSHRAKKLEVATILKEASKMCRLVMLACHKKHSSTWIPVSRTSHRHKRGKPPSFVATTIEKNIWLWISLRTWIKIYHIYCSILVDFHEQKMFARLCYNHFEKSNIWKSSGLIKTSFNRRKMFLMNYVTKCLMWILGVGGSFPVWVDAYGQPLRRLREKTR